jgi:hypothetical protein
MQTAVCRYSLAEETIKRNRKDIMYFICLSVLFNITGKILQRLSFFRSLPKSHLYNLLLLLFSYIVRSLTISKKTVKGVDV